ncbi:MAG TPA: hypothetical protein VFH43_14860 [Candidatus Kapabacteria bacterium]|nr:hypothetical protein [Candidatus Kapabacteria bacterium]
MTCHEARRLLYDVQVSRETQHDAGSRDERASLLLLARAHLHVCVACNDYFERERELARSLRDRISHLTQPMPQEVLAGVLKTVHDARMKEVGERPAPRIIGWLKSLFYK